jgi:hypothetical protein
VSSRVRPPAGFLLALLVAGESGCAFGLAVGRDGVAVRWEVADVRVGWKEAKAGEVSTKASKHAMSDNALAFGEQVAPLVAEAAARGATEGALAGTGAGLACKVPGLVEAAVDLLDEPEVVVDPELVELTPEALAELRERRAKRKALWEAAERNESPEDAAKRAEIDAAWESAIAAEEKRLRKALEAERSEP